ncbi:MAG: hypothetical protein ACI82F_004638 [Planctomycetota bacterium]|jgi:hypothetical protein
MSNYSAASDRWDYRHLEAPRTRTGPRLLTKPGLSERRQRFREGPALGLELTGRFGPGEPRVALSNLERGPAWPPARLSPGGGLTPVGGTSSLAPGVNHPRALRYPCKPIVAPRSSRDCELAPGGGVCSPRLTALGSIAGGGGRSRAPIGTGRPGTPSSATSRYSAAGSTLHFAARNDPLQARSHRHAEVSRHQERG